MKRKINPCLCGGDVDLIKRRHSSGMDGCYEEWEFNCKKCGGCWTWAADNFYGRQSYTKDDVIDIWNKIHQREDAIISVRHSFSPESREILKEQMIKYGFLAPDMTVTEFVKDLPPVNPQQKTGHWVKYGIPRCGEQHYKCTLCGYYINFGQWGELYTKEFKYCPNCGHPMIESQESEG